MMSQESSVIDAPNCGITYDLLIKIGCFAKSKNIVSV